MKPFGDHEKTFDVHIGDLIDIQEKQTCMTLTKMQVEEAQEQGGQGGSTQCPFPRITIFVMYFKEQKDKI